MTRDLTLPTFALRDARGCSDATLLEFKLKHPNSRRSPAQRAGLAYEKKALNNLEIELPYKLLRHPAFSFRNGTRLVEYAIPDAIYLHDNILTIFEVKLKHTADAWYQLNNLYRPIISRAYPGLEINLCEICRDYDPEVRLASSQQIIENIEAFVSRAQSDYGIFLYSGRT